MCTAKCSHYPYSCASLYPINYTQKGDECGAAQGAGNESDLEDEFLFDPFDINSDGRIIKTASRCSASSWRHPEPGYDVAITVHRFSELVGKKGMGDPQEKADDDGVKVRAREVEPNLQLRFKLRGGDKGKTFSQVCAEIDDKVPFCTSTFRFLAILHNNSRPRYSPIPSRDTSDSR